MELKTKTKKVLAILEKRYTKPQTALNSSNTFELLIATILSAQCTDKRVNQETPALFKKYKKPADYAKAKLPSLEKDLSSINFFRNKAKSIQGCTSMLDEDFGGKVPKTIEELTKLPGVGRKTANIILGNAFGIQALAVDTHVKRVATRLGLTTNSNPDKIEADLTSIIPEKNWTNTTHWLVFHGREVCNAKKPKCGECKLTSYCDYFQSVVQK